MLIFGRPSEISFFLTQRKTAIFQTVCIQSGGKIHCVAISPILQFCCCIFQVKCHHHDHPLKIVPYCKMVPRRAVAILAAAALERRLCCVTIVSLGNAKSSFPATNNWKQRLTVCVLGWPQFKNLSGFSRRGKILRK